MKKRVLTILLALVMTLGTVGTLGTVSVFAIGNYGVNLDSACYSSSNPYRNYWGQCTWYAWGRALEKTGVQLPYRGNANSWTSNAVSTPRTNSVAVWTGGQYGHVAFVESYDGTNIYISEANRISGQYTEGVINLSTRRFTYTYGGSGSYTVDLPNGYTYCGDIGPDTSHNPVGAFDVVQDKCGAIFVRGWAFDPDDKSKQIDVHVYIGAPSTAAGGEGHAITANTYRNDVNNVYGCGDYHGFDSVIETQKTGNQTVYVYGINIGTGDNQLIGTQTVNISNPNPVGYIDAVEDKGESIHVRGWAYDPNDTSKSIDLHVYIGGGSFADGGEAHVIKADVKRTEVNKAYGVGDYHGFDAVITTSKLGSQPVYIYGINIGYGWDNTCFGSRTVSITKHTHSLVKTAAKAATTTSEGNIEYWTCSSCGKIFKDSAGTVEISKADTVIPKLSGENDNTSGSNDNNSSAGNNSSAIATIQATLPTVKISKPKAAKKSVTVRWKKISKKNQKKVKKVQIQISTDSSFNSVAKTTTASAKKTSKKVKGLAKGTKYYLRIRALNGSHVSAWSGVKSFKAK